MRVTSDQDHTWDVDYLLPPTGEGDLVAISLRDERPLSMLAAEFDGVQVLTSHMGRGETRMQEVTGLVSISRNHGTTVAIRLMPGGDG